MTSLTGRDFSRGFLPSQDPLTSLPEPFAVWEGVAKDLSKLALSNYLRPTLESMPPFPLDKLVDLRQYERAMTMLSYMANLYIFGPGLKPATRLPQSLAQPWVHVSQRVGRPPALTYASQTQHNWRRIDPYGPVAVGNLVLVQNFLGGMDEEWFVTIHITIEAEAGRALKLLLPAQKAVIEGDTDNLESYLLEIADTLQSLHDILNRMPERCDPNIYYHRVRPYMFGWKDNPELPGGLIYEGVEAFGGQPREFRGGTGAQSSIIPALDATLGITHEFDAMRAYLMEMRDYMPPQDRAFIELLEQGPSVREFVLERKHSHPTLRETYNFCIEKLHQFRKSHIEYAAIYIIKPAHGERQAEVGTGGTPFTFYLKKHIEETVAHII